jgi:hypothetical protein
MRRRAVAGVATQGVSPVMAMLVALVVALILLLADPVKAQETTSQETTVEKTTAEETTVLAADAADRKVEAETDNVSVEVDNGKVSVSTDDGSSSDDGTSQQSSVTVQQNQATDGTGSRASTGDVNIGASQTSSSSCQNRVQVVSLDNTDGDGSDSRTFSTQGKKFRVSYSVNFQNDRNNNNQFTIRIDNSSGARVVNDVVKRADVQNGSFSVNKRANNYNIQATGTPANTNFDVTVDDCRGNNNNNNNNNNNRNRHHRHHDRNRHHHRHHDRDRHHNRFFGGGAANRQYTSERIVEERVIKDTIPDKGTLAKTGGVPLTGAAVLALASVGLGVSVLRFAVRRDQ